jgi:hypothetical protein
MADRPSAFAQALGRRARILLGEAARARHRLAPLRALARSSHCLSSSGRKTTVSLLAIGAKGRARSAALPRFASALALLCRKPGAGPVAGAGRRR